MNETTEPNLGAFRDVPFMGVIFVVQGPSMDNTVMGLERLTKMLGS